MIPPNTIIGKTSFIVSFGWSSRVPISECYFIYFLIIYARFYHGIVSQIYLGLEHFYISYVMKSWSIIFYQTPQN